MTFDLIENDFDSKLQSVRGCRCSLLLRFIMSPERAKDNIRQHDHGSVPIYEELNFASL